MTAPPSTTAGRVAFVGSGPGDPGLLTVRAREALASATYVVADPGVPAEVVALLDRGTTALRHVGGEAEVSPLGEADEPSLADGAEISAPLPEDPAALAGHLVDQARGGESVVRLVVGDPLTRESVIAEVKGVAAASRAVRRRPGHAREHRRPRLRGRGARFVVHRGRRPRRARLDHPRRSPPARSCSPRR